MICINVRCEVWFDFNGGAGLDVAFLALYTQAWVMGADCDCGMLTGFAAACNETVAVTCMHADVELYGCLMRGK